MIGAPIPEVICDQANIQKPTFHLENAGCLHGVCSRYGLSGRGVPPPGRDERKRNFLSCMSSRLFQSILVFPKKLQQSTVNLLCVCPSYAVRPILVYPSRGGGVRTFPPPARWRSSTSEETIP